MAPGACLRCPGTRGMSPTPVASLPRPLLTNISVMPTGKGKIFKGSRSISPEPVMKTEFGAERQSVDN